jgi:hypothetical protein
MNQITENIACNSESYSQMLDTNDNNRRLHKVLNNIVNVINNSKHTAQSNETIPIPKIRISHIVKYFNINFFDEPFSVIVTNIERMCNSFVLSYRLEAKHQVVINSSQYIANGKRMVSIIYQGWPVFIKNRTPNFPEPGKDTITIVYTQDIFHFTFHSGTSKYENGECISEEWENKTKGAFHIKLDCIRKERRTNPETPLLDLSHNKQPYFPLVYDTSMNQFMTMGVIVGKTPNVYTSTKTKDGDNRCHNEDALDIWYVLNNKCSFNFIDSSGITQNYIQKVIEPIYNYIVKQINHSMTLPSEHALYFERPSIFENDLQPTLLDCTKRLPVSRDVIMCKADPRYSEIINNTNLDILKKINEVTPVIILTPGGNRRKTMRKKSSRNKSKRRGCVFHRI